MNTWSQQDKNYTNLLLTGYECKPVKIEEETGFAQSLLLFLIKQLFQTSNQSFALELTLVFEGSPL